MHTAILGGSGLIGCATAAQLLALGGRVTVLSRTRPAQAISGADWRQADAADAAQLKSALRGERFDAFVHLAALLQFACEADPAMAVRVNVDGTLNALEACREAGIPRFVFGSSVAVYGARTDTMREEDPPAADTGLYGMTKRLGEQVGERYAALYGLEFVALRYAGVFGPGEVHGPGMALVRQRIKESADGRDVCIDGASGDEWIHLTHVTDAAAATCRALLHPRPAHCLYNVAGPAANYMSLKAFHATLRTLAPGAGQVTWQGRGRTTGPLDLSRLRADLGFEPAVSVAQGLAADLGLARLTDRPLRGEN